jgi:ribosomal protein S18 acetylase RimI-like enzyme
MTELVALYQRAFWDDPAIVHLVPDEKTRGRALDAYMRMVIRYGLRWGRVQTIEQDGRIRVGAVWLPPGGAPASVLKQLRCGLLPVLFSNFNWRNLRNFFALGNKLEELHRKDVARYHWYLWLLAVDPPDQGSGFGSAVVAPELREADTGNFPCYVETAKTVNLDFYQKQGFVIKREITMPGNGPPLWTLVRDPVR